MEARTGCLPIITLAAVAWAAVIVLAGVTVALVNAALKP